VLSDPEKRRRYDTLGPDWQRYAEGGVPGGGAGNVGDFRVHVEPGGDLGDFSDFFRTIFADLGRRARRAPAEGEAEDVLGGVFGRRRRGAPGQDLLAPVEITLEEAAEGTRRTVELQREERCATCGGSGQHAGAVCAACRGTGQVVQSHRVEVKIPAGVREGSRVRATGEGGAGTGGGPRGDLYLQIRVAPHPTFQRRDDDLYVDLALAPWEAALGAEVEVPTLRGKVTMKIPPETSSGKTFRLRGYGMPRLRGSGQGDQLVRAQIVIPSDLSPRERELYEELRRQRPRKGS